MNNFLPIAAGFVLNLVAVFIIVRYLYYPNQRDKHYVFTFVTFNMVIFFVMALMNSNDISVGAGFGMFAIFSILRYRTDTIPIREMTYLFVLIALSVVNALFVQNQAYVELAVVNGLIIAVLTVLERGWGFQFETRKTITYERIELVKPEKWDDLLADLRQRTGLPISHVEIGKLDFVKDTAEIRIYYDPTLIGRPTPNVTMNGGNGNGTTDEDD